MVKSSLLITNIRAVYQDELSEAWLSKMDSAYPTTCYPRARALPGHALPGRLCLPAAVLTAAEPLGPCVPKRSLGTRKVEAQTNYYSLLTADRLSTRRVWRQLV